MSVWDAISIYHAPDIFLTQFNSAPVAARSLFAAHWCQSEVRNGGLHQFFSNSTGILAPEAIAAYQMIGMPKLASVIEAAARWFGSDYPRRREIRQELLDSCETEHPEGWNPFSRLDDEFFALIDQENGGFRQAADEYATKQGG
jgi:hypothetical protein